jgi:hypothetical protein
MQEKLSDFKAENHLLGRCVEDLKRERDRLAKRLAATSATTRDAQAEVQRAVELSEHQVRGWHALWGL